MVPENTPAKEQPALERVMQSDLVLPAPSKPTIVAKGISRKVKAAIAEFTEVAGKRFWPVPHSGPWQIYSNIADNFVRAERDLLKTKGDSSPKNQSLVFSEPRVVNMFYSKEFMPTCWNTLSPEERTQAITEALKIIAPDIRKRFDADYGRSGHSATSRRTSRSKSPKVAEAVVTKSLPASRSEDEDIEFVRNIPEEIKLHSQEGQIQDVDNASAERAEPANSPQRDAAPDTFPKNRDKEVVINTSSPETTSTAIENMPVETYASTPFNWALLNTRITQVPFNHRKVQEALENHPSATTVLDLLNIPSRELRQWCREERISFDSLRQQIARMHPGFLLLLSDLEELWINEETETKLAQQKVPQMMKSPLGIAPDPSAPYLVVDNGFRLVTSPKNVIALLTPEEFTKAQGLFLSYGFAQKKA